MCDLYPEMCYFLFLLTTKRFPRPPSGIERRDNEDRDGMRWDGSRGVAKTIQMQNTALDLTDGNKNFVFW